MACFGVQTLLSAAFSGSAITMMQTSTPKSIQGTAISAYFAVATLAQSFGPLICSELAKVVGAATKPALYGPLICALVAVGYTGSVPLWWKAGKAYEARLEAAEQRKNKARSSLESEIRDTIPVDLVTGSDLRKIESTSV